jgi:hypothetical protein
VEDPRIGARGETVMRSLQEDPGINISTVFCENLLKIEMYLSV